MAKAGKRRVFYLENLAENSAEHSSWVGDLPSEIPKEQYKAIFDALPAMNLVLSPDFRMVAANFARFRGTMSEPENVIGKNVFDIFPDNPNDPKATGVTNLRASLERVLAYRVPDRMAIQKYDIPRPASEGGGFEEHYWSPLNVPILNEKGEVQYIVHQVEDVTDLVRFQRKAKEYTAFNEQMKREIDERRGVEARLRESERFAHEERQKFESIFSVSPAALALLSGPDLVVEKANPGLRMLCGNREILGKKFFDAFPELKDTAIEGIFNRVFETGESYSASEYKLMIERDAQGSMQDLYVDYSCQRIANGTGRPYGVFLHAIDVTDKVIARNIRERFVATLSHDLRNPLTTARLSTQLALRQRENVEALQQNLSRTLRSLARADRMIQDLLDVNRIKAGGKLSIDVSECDLKKLISESLEELTLVYGNRFVLQSPEQVVGYWGCDDLRRVLENLCTNAVKYGASDTPITISVKPEKERVLISVHNFGPVIPIEQQSKLFEAFQRSAQAQESGKQGWGLGLALVRGISEAHFGRVDVTSAQNEGTTFTVSLPWDVRARDHEE